MLASEIYFPESLQETLDLMRTRPEALLYAGGTEILRTQSEPYVRFPREILSIGGIPELRQVLLTERFVEIGAAVTLAEILELRENAVPELFFPLAPRSEQSRRPLPRHDRRQPRLDEPLHGRLAPPSPASTPSSSSATRRAHDGST